MPSQLGLDKFNIGLLGDKSAALSIYKTGLKQCENAIPEVLGPIKKRGGFEFVRDIGVVTNSNYFNLILFPFVYNNEESYVLIAKPDDLEIYDPNADTISKVLYWTDWKGDLMEWPDLRNISMYQIQDVVYICGVRYGPNGLSAPLKLTRLDKSGTKWTLEPIVFKDGPWLPENATDITITSNVACTENTTKEGTAVKLTFSSLPTEWKRITTDTQIRLFTINQTTSAWAWFRVTSVDTTNKVLNCTYGGGTCYASAASKIWRFSACLKGSQPTCCTIFEGRMCYAWDKYVFLSKSGAYNTFSPTNTAGTVSNSDAITAIINMKQSSDIRWIVTDKNLLVGTDNEEYAIKADDYGTALTPTNVNAQQQSTMGSIALPPTNISGGVIAIKKFGKKAIFYGYASDSYSYGAKDLSIYNTDITEPGITDTAFTSDPDPILWYVLADGTLVSQTLQIKDDVLAFAHHTTFHDSSNDGTALGKVKRGFGSITSIPDAKTGNSVLYALVCRKGNDVNLERLSNGISTQKSTDEEGIYYSDCWIKNTSDTPITRWVNDGSHGKVWSSTAGVSYSDVYTVLADGAVQPDVTVKYDPELKRHYIDLQYPAKEIVIGYKYTMCVQPTEIGVQGIVLDSRKKNVYNIYPRLYKTVGMKVGTEMENLQTIPFRNTSDKMNSPVPLYTGLMKVPLQGGWNKTGSIIIAHDQPLPWCMLALYFDINIGG